MPYRLRYSRTASSNVFDCRSRTSFISLSASFMRYQIGCEPEPDTSLGLGPPLMAGASSQAGGLCGCDGDVDAVAGSDSGVGVASSIFGGSTGIRNTEYTQIQKKTITATERSCRRRMFSTAQTKAPDEERSRRKWEESPENQATTNPKRTSEKNSAMIKIKVTVALLVHNYPEKSKAFNVLGYAFRVLDCFRRWKPRRWLWLA